MCLNNLSSHRTTDWLTNLITGDESWVFYVNHTHKSQWHGKGDKGIPTPKRNQSDKKVMLSVCWNVNRIIYWELLPNGTTVNKELYCEQLDRLHEKLKGIQDRV